MMHDWVFISLMVEWEKATVTLKLKNNNSKEVLLKAEGLIDLKMSKREEWGESVSINEVEGPLELESGNKYLLIEIQSGDKIELEAKSIKLPG